MMDPDIRSGHRAVDIESPLRTAYRTVIGIRVNAATCHPQVVRSSIGRIEYLKDEASGKPVLFLTFDWVSCQNVFDINQDRRGERAPVHPRRSVAGVLARTVTEPGI